MARPRRVGDIIHELRTSTERALVELALATTDSTHAAAAALGRSPVWLFTKMRQYRLRAPRRPGRPARKSAAN